LLPLHFFNPGTSRPAFTISSRRLWIALWLVAATPTLFPRASRCRISLAPVYVFPDPGGPCTLRFLAPSLPTVEIDVVLRDPDDAQVVAAALAGRADAIVTGDTDLLADGGFRQWLRERGVVLHTPASLLDELSGFESRP
jgi:hypothetical protein